ncbi:MAG: YdhR family protein [Desulfobacterales bacterium]|nr:YdhR family protein [Desulfobacterales bacterium]
MSSEKKALWVVFKMEDMPTKKEMRQRFKDLYHIYLDHPGIESKCWLVNEDKNEWGALYVFRSEEAVQDYLRSDLWVKEIPSRWGLTPSVVNVLDPGPILYKKTIVDPQDSWIEE